jgi:hypothetical protein
MMLNTSSVRDTTKIGALIHLLEVALKVGKYLPVIIVSFAGLNLLLAANDFFVSNTGFGILNSIFAFGGFIFFVQLLQRRKIHSYDYSDNYKKEKEKRIETGPRKESAMKRSAEIVVGTGQQREKI